MNRNAQGLQLLSQMDDSQVEDYLNNGTIFCATTHTLTEKEAIRERVKEIRSRGFSYQERENSISMKQIAVPLEIALLPNKLCLACYLPINFKGVERLTEEMMIASSTLSRTT